MTTICQKIKKNVTMKYIKMQIQQQTITGSTNKNRTTCCTL